ncbi:TPA: hypothetical protein VPE51_000234 [Streptococcus pyogenes]|uniref:Phage protein n=3 Tax=Streptococcus pyogenes TaxID=1314 RepID=A0A660A4V6_STRPY|nr:hypothetical protein [Streptococcus pyogenes]EQL82620.1 hypothetical protein HMPREF1230_0467 [Streptococcus pyogenes GA19681]ESA46545.1 hypothetical protein HMPREF1234_0550 [Streptococcus pyogenes GA41039]ESA48625.1 hypothetical protein HMPREF1235_0634 [Streptococcus pyogenes GA41208]ESA51012.1 hypothetical protein HMPREF1233_0548 [Streptococcus pyogenes GA19700]ESA53747.1 hypothetical protein HMPREF1232_0992 [Streptococcus pyogenes GA40468]ESA56434.1 hypothetical protein HMPREF1238_1017 [
MDFSDFLNKKQKEWDESHPIPDFSAMSDEELLYQPMSEALVSERFAKELSKEVRKRNLLSK